MLKHNSLTSDGVLPVTIILGTGKPGAFLVLLRNPGQSEVNLSIGRWPVCRTKRLASFCLFRQFWVNLSPFMSLVVPDRQQLRSFREKLGWWQTVAVSLTSWPRLRADLGGPELAHLFCGLNWGDRQKTAQLHSHLSYPKKYFLDMSSSVITLDFNKSVRNKDISVSFI